MTRARTCTSVQGMHLTIGVRAMMSQIDDIAKRTGFANARVDVKVNMRGELVVALLIPPRTRDEWGPPTHFNRREAARLARMDRG